VKMLAGLLVLSVAASAHAQSSLIAIDVTGEHRMASGDTPDSAKQLARVDAQRRAWSAASARLQSRDDVKALQLTPLQVDAFTAVLLDPGWVRTDMGGPHAPIEAADSVADMLRVIDGLGPRDNGRFLDRHGKPRPW